jgi:hypothetical protein
VGRSKEKAMTTLVIALVVALIPVVIGRIVNGSSKLSGVVCRDLPGKLTIHTARGQKVVRWTAKIG